VFAQPFDGMASMAQETTDRPSERTLQGQVVYPCSQEELLRVIGWAFDYRGDVTLELASGESVCGYLFNRVADGGGGGCVEIFQPDNPTSRKVSICDIRGLHFTGPDTASGQSWEAWVQKKQREGKP